MLAICCFEAAAAIVVVACFWWKARQSLSQIEGVTAAVYLEVRKLLLQSR